MRIAIHLAVAALVLSAATPAVSETIEPDLVKGTSLFEGYGAATRIGSRSLFAWSNEVGDGRRLAAFAEVNGARVSRISAKRTSAYVGGFDRGTDRVIYQQVRRGESDLFLYDIGAEDRSPLKELNDGHWQWNPSVDTHRGTMWVAYGVNRFGGPAAKWRFLLYNGATGERSVLDETTNRCGCLFPGTIAYPYVTWAVGEDATAWRYDIRTGERVPLFPTDRDEYGVTVTWDGTAYVAQAGDRCGTGAKLYRVEPDGTPFLLYGFGDGREPANLSVEWARHDRLTFDRRNCRTGSSDILRIRRADVLGEPGRPMRVFDRGGEDATRLGASSGASPRMR